MGQHLLGMVGLFKDPYHILRAAKEVHSKGFSQCDAFTPYPVHGLDQALGHKRSLVPWVTLVFGLTGCFAGLALQIWTSAIDWPLNVGGKPFISLPAFIPIAFECTILFGGIATFVALLLFCRLPNYHLPIIDRGITDVAYALYIPAKEVGFEEQMLRELLEKAGAYEVRLVE